MKKKAIANLAAAGLTVGFFAAVRPEKTPSMWIVALFAIAFFQLGKAQIHALFPEKHYLTARRVSMTQQDAVRYAQTHVGRG